MRDPAEFIRFGREFAGQPSIQLDGWIRELAGGEKLFARTDSGWWRIRKCPGFYVAYRTRLKGASQ